VVRERVWAHDAERLWEEEFDPVEEVSPAIAADSAGVPAS
jgi:hypothetical protein